MIIIITIKSNCYHLISTLARCAGDVAGFGVMFFTVFFAFAQLGYLLFGTQVNIIMNITIIMFFLFSSS